jgi:hypothetical protein
MTAEIAREAGFSTAVRTHAVTARHEAKEDRHA